MALSPIELTGIDSELIGNSVSVNPYEPLMHYMKFEYFMQILTSKSLRIKRLDTYKDDPLEGLYPEANKRQLSGFDSALFQQLDVVQHPEDRIRRDQFHRQSAYVHCWYAGILENKSMWEEYGDDGRGVCLLTTACRLESSVKHSADLLTSVSKITYLDGHTPIPTAISFLAFSRKQTKFANEKEIRLIAEITLDALPKDAEGHLQIPEENRQLPVDLERLIEAVVTGPNFDRDNVAMLETAISDKISGKIVRFSEVAAW